MRLALSRTQGNIFILAPRRVSSLSTAAIVDVACGEAHTVTIDALGQLYTFGKGASGQLGTGLLLDSPWPVRVDVMLTKQSKDPSTMDGADGSDPLRKPDGDSEVPVRFVLVAAGVSHSAVRAASDGGCFGMGCDGMGWVGMGSRCHLWRSVICAECTCR